MKGCKRRHAHILEVKGYSCYFPHPSTHTDTWKGCRHQIWMTVRLRPSSAPGLGISRLCVCDKGSHHGQNLTLLTSTNSSYLLTPHPMQWTGEQLQAPLVSLSREMLGSSSLLASAQDFCISPASLSKEQPWE